jgi:hypothetical protein
MMGARMNITFCGVMVLPNTQQHGLTGCHINLLRCMMKVGDLVRPTKGNLLSGPRRIGIVMYVNTGRDHKQVMVHWDTPLWLDVEGLSSECPENIEVISEGG